MASYFKSESAGGGGEKRLNFKVKSIFKKRKKIEMKQQNIGFSHVLTGNCLKKCDRFNLRIAPIFSIATILIQGVPRNMTVGK